MTHLFDHICWASENLQRVETSLVVVYEDPEEPDAPAKVLVPAPEWMAMALHGGLLPPVDHYHLEQRDSDGTFTGPKTYWTTEGFDPVGPMTEEQAVEYLIQKDIPRRVWDPPEGSNVQHFVICRREQLPQTRRWRNAWQIARP